MTLQSLLTRAQQATGADRELDVLLHAVLVEDRAIRWSGNLLLGRSNKPPHDECVLGSIDPGVSARNFSSGYSKPPWPDYTASVGAALGLVERVLPGWRWERQWEPGGEFIRLLAPDYHRFEFMGALNRRATGWFPCDCGDALALICALLTAKIAEAQPHEKED